MGPGKVEGECCIVGVSPVFSDCIISSFQTIKGFPCCFYFIKAFPVNKELSLSVVDSVIEYLFNFPMFSKSINGDWFWRCWCGLVWEGFMVWSEVDSEVASVDPWVNAFHNRW